MSKLELELERPQCASVRHFFIITLSISKNKNSWMLYRIVPAKTLDSVYCDSHDYTGIRMMIIHGTPDDALLTCNLMIMQVT